MQFHTVMHRAVDRIIEFPINITWGVSEKIKMKLKVFMRAVKCFVKRTV